MPDNSAAPASPVRTAARFNQYTPRSSGALAAVPAAPVAARPELAGPADAPLAFRDRVRQRTGQADLLLFRVGAEIFALPLDAVEEAVELDIVHPVPESSEHSLGVVDLRGRMLSLFSLVRPLGVRNGTAGAMLVLRDGRRRVGVAIDEVDDVFAADLSGLRPVPDGDAGDGVLLAIARRGTDLVGVLDVHLLLAACLAEARPPETAA